MLINDGKKLQNCEAVVVRIIFGKMAVGKMAARTGRHVSDRELKLLGIGIDGLF